MPSTQRKKPSKAGHKAEPPSEVAPGVFVGGWKQAVGFPGTSFCFLDEEPEGMPPATHVRIYDEAKDAAIVANLERIAKAAGAARAGGKPVLFFCGHGVRRSPLAAAWFLHRSEGISLDTAYDRIRAVRPQIEAASEWIGHVDELRTA